MYTPHKHNRFRHRDPAREADPTKVSVKPAADKDRKHHLMEADDTTICMPIPMFRKEFLGVGDTDEEAGEFKNAFSAVFPEDKIKTISKKLREGLKKLAGGTTQKEKLISRTWVSGVYITVRSCSTRPPGIHRQRGEVAFSLSGALLQSIRKRLRERGSQHVQDGRLVHRQRR